MIKKFYLETFKMCWVALFYTTSILDMFVVLYKQLNCAVDKTIGTGHSANY